MFAANLPVDTLKWMLALACGGATKKVMLVGVKKAQVNDMVKLEDGHHYVQASSGERRKEGVCWRLP